jgi:hypothetical protein
MAAVMIQRRPGDNRRAAGPHRRHISLLELGKDNTA